MQEATGEMKQEVTPDTTTPTDLITALPPPRHPGHIEVGVVIGSRVTISGIEFKVASCGKKSILLEAMPGYSTRKVTQAEVDAMRAKADRERRRE